jgi:multimeric flavodoxin WrbA
LKIIVVTAYPRKEGFTRYCTDLFIKGLVQANVDYTVYDLTREMINPCRGCFHCWNNTPGICIQKDDMEKMLEAFLNADAIVAATPLYAFGMGSYLKIFLERTLPLLKPGISYSENGIDRNRIRYPDRGPRHMAAIITGGLSSPVHTEGASASLRLYAESFNMQFHGPLIRNESFLLQFVDTKPLTIKTIETALETAGRMFALEGRIDRETVEKISTPLAGDRMRFQMYSNIYWEHAKKVYAAGGTAEEIKNLTRSDLRILMHEMISGIDPVTTAHTKAVLQFNFPDISLAYMVTIDHGTARILQTETAEADLFVTCHSTVWAGILHRTTDPVKALSSGEIRLKGDKMLFRKLGRFFPPPNT